MLKTMARKLSVSLKSFNLLYSCFIDGKKKTTIKRFFVGR